MPFACQRKGCHSAHSSVSGCDSKAWLEWNGVTIDLCGDQFGWEPVIYTVSNGDYPLLDPTLAKNVPEGM